MERDQAMKFMHDLLRLMSQKKGSDLFITSGFPPAIKMDGKVTPVSNQVLTQQHTAELARSIMNDRQAAEFESTRECNFAISPTGIGRFRVNALVQQGRVAVVLRTINMSIPTLDDLGLPPVLKDLGMTKRGLIVMVGGTGTGKTTSLAALVDYRNENSFGHIITVEDPIEYVHEHKNCIVTQREIGVDTEDWGPALKNTLRQAPDVIVMGEIRDRQTMDYAIAFAETGHLALATLHANSTNQAIDRIINFFPEERRQQLLMDTIESLKPIYAAGMSERMLQRFKTTSWQAAKANHKFGLNAAIMQHIAGLLTVVAGVATICWSLTRIWEGHMTGGAMVATMIITWRVLYPLQALCAVLPHMEQIRASLLQVSQLMAFTPEAHAAHVVLAEHPLKGQVSIQNLGLRYGRKSDPVFMGLSADIEAGEIVAVYGGNGSGKSSLLRLLLGLYAPAMGSIRLDGVDHRQFDPRSLRRQIAYLPQMPELLPGTVAENLRVHHPLAEEYQLRQALLWADAWEMVEELPAGLNTRVGEGGFIPSSGFASRLTLARLYLADRPLVLCDELSGQLLNSSTGERFRQYLEECRGKRTVLFVTHREDWLSLADKVIWLQADMRPVVSRPNDSTPNAA